MHPSMSYSIPMTKNIFTILLFCVLSSNAFSVTDSISYIATGNCCYDLTVKNRNPNRAEIKRVILTAPGKIISASAPYMWIVERLNVDSVIFFHLGGANYLFAGASLSGFNVCFAPSGLINVNWETFSFGGLPFGVPISTGSFSVSCSNASDSLSYAVNGNCCFNFKVKNRNSRNQFINRVVIKAPGRIVSATAPPNWSMTKNADSVIFNTGSTQYFIHPGDSLSGFVVCFTNTGPVDAA